MKRKKGKSSPSPFLFLTYVYPVHGTLGQSLKPCFRPYLFNRHQKWRVYTYSLKCDSRESGGVAEGRLRPPPGKRVEIGSCVCQSIRTQWFPTNVTVDDIVKMLQLYNKRC